MYRLAYGAISRRWNDLERTRKPHVANPRRRARDQEGSTHEREKQDDGLAEADNETVESGGEIDWSETNSPGRSLHSLTPRGEKGAGGIGRSFADMSTLPLNIGNVSVASWDGASEPTIGTDVGTDQDVAAVSGIPDGDSDDDEDDDEFEVADSRDLGAVNLCVSVVTARVMSYLFAVGRLLPIDRTEDGTLQAS